MSKDSSSSSFSFRAAVSDRLARSRFASIFGLTFDDKRDLYSSLGYKQVLSVADYRRRYQRGGIAKRIVNGHPELAFVGGCSIFEDPDPDVETQFEEQVASLDKRLGLWSTFRRLAVLGRLGRNSALLIGTKDNNLDAEMPRLSGPDDIIYLKPYAEDRAQIHRIVGERNEEASDPRFGLPLYYQIKISDSLTRRVHWSRVIHYAEDAIEDSVYGPPALEAVWNYLDDLDKIVGGGSEASYQLTNPGKHFDLDPEYTYGDKEKEAIKEQVEEFDHGLTRNLYTRGLKLTRLSANVNSFGPNADAVFQFVCGTTKYSKRWLLGAEVGELASSQDRANMQDRTTEYRALNSEPLVNDFIYRLIDYGALVTPQDREFLTLWPVEDEMGESEKAKLTVDLARANQSQVLAKQSPILTSDEIRDLIWKMEPLEIEDENTKEVAGQKEAKDEDGKNGDEEGDDNEEGRNLASKKKLHLIRP